MQRVGLQFLRVDLLIVRTVDNLWRKRSKRCVCGEWCVLGGGSYDRKGRRTTGFSWRLQKITILVTRCEGRAATWELPTTKYKYVRPLPSASPLQPAIADLGVRYSDF